MAQFAVLKRGSGWEVFRNGSALRRHQTRLDAIEDAYMLAVDVQTVCGRPELLVQDEGGELERWAVTAWTGVSRRSGSILA